jgi:outer membrane biogenesis lipoprotein LolB
MNRGVVPALAAGAALLASCGVPRLALPTGPGLPADATAAMAQATSACRAVSTFSAEIAVRGSIEGRRVRARLLAGLAPPAALRIEAVAPFGQPTFVLTSVDRDASVVLSDGRVLEHGPASEVFEALTGLPIQVDELKTVLTGCAAAPDAGAARAYGSAWLVVPDGAARLYLHRDSADAPWRVAAAAHQPIGVEAWQAEYGGIAGALPRSVRLIGGRRFDLQLSLSQVAVDEPISDAAFRARVPADAVPITLEELRRSTPWAEER